MVRPKIERKIGCRAAHSCFKPNGIPMSELDQIPLLAEEFEALRLSDLEGLNQQACAEQMGISRQTFGNIIKRARNKTAQSLIEGKALMLNK